MEIKKIPQIVGYKNYDLRYFSLLI